MAQRPPDASFSEPHLGTVEGLRRYFGAHRLRLDGLGRAEQVGVIVALTVAAICATLLLSEAVPLKLPGGRVAMPTLDNSRAVTLVPTMVLTMVSLGFGCAAGLVGAAALHRGRWLRLVMLALLTLSGIATATTIAADEFVPPAVHWFCWAVVVVTAAVYCAASVGRVRNVAVVAVLAAVPWLVLAAMFVHGFNWLGEFALTDALVAVQVYLGAALLGLFGWQVVEGLRGTLAAAGTMVERAVAGRPGVIPLAASGITIVLMIAIRGAWPEALGGASEAFVKARGDGPLVWLIAFAIASGIVAGALLVERTPDSDRWLSSAIVVVIVLWLAGTIVTAVAVMSGAIALKAGMAPDAWLFDTLYWIPDQSQHFRIATVILAGIVGGLLLWRWPRLRAVGFVLVTLGLWQLPAAFNIVTGRSGADSVRPELVTLVAAIATVIAVLSAAPTRWRASIITYALLLLLFGAAAAAEPINATLENLFSPLGSATFYLTLIFPAAYLFFANADGLRPRDGEPPVRLLVIAAASVAALSLALLDVSLDLLRPDVPAIAAGDKYDVRIAIVVPVAAALVSARGAHEITRARAASARYRLEASARRRSVDRGDRDRGGRQAADSRDDLDGGDAER